MPLPTFSHDTYGTVTFSRAYLATSGRKPPRPNQRVAKTDAGTYLVATLSAPEVQIPLEFQQIPTADIAALEAFFAPDALNGAAHTFTFTDVDATAATVRCLDWEATRVTPTLWNVTMLLVVEP